MNWKWMIFWGHLVGAGLAIVGVLTKSGIADRVGLAAASVAFVFFAWFWYQDAREGVE